MSSEFEVLPLERADWTRVADITYDAFDGAPILVAMYGPDSPSSRRLCAEVMEAKAREEPAAQVFKCIDRSSGKMVGFVRWDFFEHERPESEWRKPRTSEWIDDEERKKFVERLFVPSDELRMKTWEGRPFALIAALAVDPNFQRRGAGTLLLQRGLDVAKKMGLSAHVVGSAAGSGLYKKLGFHTIDEVDMTPPGAERNSASIVQVLIKKPSDAD